MKQKILIISPLPKPDYHAGDRRLFFLLKILAKHNYVDLWIPYKDTTLSEVEIKKYIKNLIQIKINVFPIGEKLDNILGKHFYHLGIFEFYKLAQTFSPIFRTYQSHAKVIVDSVDLHFIREKKKY